MYLLKLGNQSLISECLQWTIMSHCYLLVQWAGHFHWFTFKHLLHDLSIICKQKSVNLCSKLDSAWLNHAAFQELNNYSLFLILLWNIASNFFSASEIVHMKLENNNIHIWSMRPLCTPSWVLQTSSLLPLGAPVLVLSQPGCRLGLGCSKPNSCQFWGAVRRFWHLDPPLCNSPAHSTLQGMQPNTRRCSSTEVHELLSLTWRKLSWSF